MGRSVYMYKAALYCEPCGQGIIDRLTAEGKLTLAETEDSDSWPQGLYPDGGGKADTPQHCHACLVFLENPLTDEGREYVKRSIIEWFGNDHPGVNRPILYQWWLFYSEQGDITLNDLGRVVIETLREEVHRIGKPDPEEESEPRPEERMGPITGQGYE